MSKATTFRVGKVSAYRRGNVWYLCYFEHGKRRRPRVGPDRNAARQLAAQINGQLEVGAPAALSFELISIADLRTRWLARSINLAGHTAPKVFRHQFATALQEGRVDPLVRNLLMGHAAAGEHSEGFGLVFRHVLILG